MIDLRAQSCSIPIFRFELFTPTHTAPQSAKPVVDGLLADVS